MSNTTIKKAKLNKTQLKEFAASGITTEYANLNFVNITAPNTKVLLKANSSKDEARLGTALKGGWSDPLLSTFKPKFPRQQQGDIVKYEGINNANLIEVKHPESVSAGHQVTYIVEGLKKAVAVAEQTKSKTYAFTGVTIGIHLIDELNSIKGSKRLILDNDNSISAINTARALVNKLQGSWEIALFSFFKGIDDALANGVKFTKIKFVQVSEWCTSISGYVDGNNYSFHKPQFENPVISKSIRFLQILADKGLGKSWFLRQKAVEAIANGIDVFAVTHRINLSRKLSKEIGIPYIDDENYSGGSAGLCIDSLLKIPLSSFTGALLILDEITQVLDHLHNSDTLRSKRSTIYKRFIEVLKHIKETGGLVIVADADLDYKSSKLLTELGEFSKDETYLIRNTYQFEKGFCGFSEGIGKITKKGESKRKNPSNILAKLRKEAKAGKKLFCCLSAQKVESKYSTQVIEQWLIANGIPASNILRIDSETIGDLTHAAYKAAERIDELCAKYQILLVSPTLNTGCDIQYKGFDYVLGIFSGVLASNDVRQFLSRVRDWKVPRIFYAPQIRQNFESIGITTTSDYALFTSSCADAQKLIDEQWYSAMQEESRNKIFQASQSFFLRQSWEQERDKFDYLQRIKVGLIKEGFEVAEYVEESNAIECSVIVEELTEIKESLTAAQQELVERCEIQSEDAAKKLYELTSLTTEEKCGLKGFEIRRKFGLAPTAEVQAILTPQKVSALENQFAAEEGLEVTKALQEKQQYWSQERKDKQEVAHDFVKRNVRSQRIAALSKVGFFDIITKPFNAENADELLAELRGNRLNFKLFPSLPKEATKQSIKAVKAIAKLFNYDVQKLSQSHSGDRSYVAVDAGLIIFGEDAIQKVMDFWLKERTKKASDWQAFKADIYLVKRGEALDKTAKPKALNEDFKYTKLSTRAKTLPLPLMPNYKMVNADNVIEFRLWIASQPEVAVDVETYGEGKKGGLNHITGFIRLVQFATTDSIWVLERNDFDLVRDEITNFLANANQRKIGHNFMFDLRFLRKEFGVLARNCADTMLGSRCLLGDMGAAQISKHSLKQACENFLGLEVDKSEQASDWGAVLTAEQIAYAAKDPWLTCVLYQRLVELTKKPSLLLLPFPEMMAYEAWEVENSFLFAAQQMEDTGYQIDIEALNNAKAKYQSVRDDLMSQWGSPFLPSQKAKLMQFLNEKYNLNLNSLGKATAAENSDIPEIKLMQQICACDAIIGTLQSIEKQVELYQGYVKPHFNVLTGTGRTSSGATKIEKCLINLQSLSSRVNPALKGLDLPSLKSLFLTDLIIDLPASHGRISAELGNDENALAAYMDESIDLHCQTATAVAQAVFPDENYNANWIQANKKSNPIAKGLRDTAKNTYYGWLNGAGASTIQRQIKSNLQINADKGACGKALKGLQDVFRGTTDFAKEKLKELENNQFIVNGVVCGFMEFAGTYLSWKLGVVGGDLNVPATKAFAGIWSRTEALLMKRSCYRIAEQFNVMPEWKSKLQNFIHDEINCEIGCNEAAIFAHSVVKEEFGRICHRTIVGFDPIEKCYPLKNWSDK